MKFLLHTLWTHIPSTDQCITTDCYIFSSIFPNPYFWERKKNPICFWPDFQKFAFLILPLSLFGSTPDSLPASAPVRAVSSVPSVTWAYCSQPPSEISPLRSGHFQPASLKYWMKSHIQSNISNVNCMFLLLICFFFNQNLHNFKKTAINTEKLRKCEFDVA